MPNLCIYSMKAVGNKDNLKKLVEIMNRDYHTDGNDLPHLWRVFSVNVYDEGDNYVCLWGDCAWSVYSCMFDGENTYQGEYKNDPLANGTTIDALAKELNLTIEIWSEEYGCGFQEHFLISSKGKILIDDCKEAEEEYDEEKNEFTEKIIGGFENYCEFSI